MERKNTGKVMTVLGPIEPEKMGHTITHEHLYFDLTCYRDSDPTPEQELFYYEPLTLRNLNKIKKDPYGNRDNCMQLDRDVTLRELAAYKYAGGRTICDVSPGGVNEGVMETYVPKLADLSRTSGLNIVAGFGHYIYCVNVNDETGITMGKRRPGMETMTPEEIALEYIDAINNGFGETGVLPGIIGELGTSTRLHEQEAKILRAGAIAQSETGLAITLHMHPPGRIGHEVLDILTDAGAYSEKIVLGHSDSILAHKDLEFTEAVDYYLRLLERGCYIEFDLCGNSEYFVSSEGNWWLPSDRERAKAIAKLCKHGFSDKILISQDTGHKYYLLEYGGWGYAHILDGFRNTLLEHDVAPDVVEKFTIDNPKNMLTII